METLMTKSLDFKDFLTVDYAPGLDPLIKRNAKKRKGSSGGQQAAEYESVQTENAQHPGGKPIPPLKPGQVQSYLDMGKHTSRLKGKNQMGWPTREIKVNLEPDTKGKTSHTHVHAYESVEVETIDETVLTPQQRRARAMQFKRLKSKIAIGQKRAKARFADPKRLLNRAKKMARNMIFKRLAKGMTKDELTFQRRQDIEKRMDTPGMKKRIERLAIKLLPKERKAEIARHQQAATPEK